MVPRNHHSDIPLRTAFATLLSGCDAEFALRVDPPCLSEVCPALGRGARLSMQKKPRATLHHYHSMRDEVNAAHAPTTVVSIAGQRCQRSLRKLVHVLAALRIVGCRAARRPIAVASLLFPAKLGEKIALRQLKKCIGWIFLH